VLASRAGPCVRRMVVRSWKKVVVARTDSARPMVTLVSTFDQGEAIPATGAHGASCRRMRVLNAVTFRPRIES